MATPCPECGKPIGAPEGQSALAHWHEHYGSVPRKEMSKEAKQRADAIQKIADSENRDTIPSSGIDASEE
jgi:hypothetical protein